jgi:hypothetical protein
MTLSASSIRYEERKYDPEREREKEMKLPQNSDLSLAKWPASFAPALS